MRRRYHIHWVCGNLSGSSYARIQHRGRITYGDINEVSKQIMQRYELPEEPTITNIVQLNGN